jgi:hypothetical protein
MLNLIISSCILTFYKYSTPSFILFKRKKERYDYICIARSVLTEYVLTEDLSLMTMKDNT